MDRWHAVRSLGVLSLLLTQAVAAYGHGLALPFAFWGDFALDAAGARQGSG